MSYFNPQRRPLIAFTILVFIPFGFSCQLAVCAQPPADSQWLQYRRDPTLTGRSPLSGQITTPTIKWKYECSMRQGFFRLDLDAFPIANLNIPAQELNPDHCQSIVEAWGMGPTWYQLEDGGKFPQPGPHHSNIGYFLPAQSGLQQLIFDTAFEVRGDESLPLHGRLLIRRAGQWQECWKTPPVPSMYVTNPIVADFDADGQQEVAFTPWYDLWLLDLETGNLEQKCSYKHPQAESGRAYGYLGGHNLFADERLEIVMLSNSELHLDVFGWDENGRLKVIWSRLIQPGVNQKNKRLQIMPNPVQDVDGDGQLEIVVSIYDRANQIHWHTEVIDPQTGITRYNLADFCAIDLMDLNGDGASELFGLQSDQMEPLEWNTISIIQCRNGQAETLWRQDQAAFETTSKVDFPPHYRTNTHWVRPPLLKGEFNSGRSPLFVTRRLLQADTRQLELTFWRMNLEAEIEPFAWVSGPELKGRAIASAENNRLETVLVETRFPARGQMKLETRGCRAEFKTLRRLGANPSMALVGQSADQSTSTIYVEDAMENIVALSPLLAEANIGVELQWRRPGRGYFNHDNFSTFCQGPVLLADLRGNGQISMICAGRNSKGNAKIIAYNPQGEELWDHLLENVPGSRPFYPQSGVMMWFSGHFTDPERKDVLVVYKDGHYFYRLLNGESGQMIYEGQKNGVGYSMAIFDYDGDGLDDFLAAYNHLTVVKGNTDQVLMHRRTGWGEMFRLGTFRAEPIVADFLGHGGWQILYATSQNVVALLDLDGSIIWQKCSIDGQPVSPQGVLPAVGDFDHDGQMEMCGIAWHDGQPDSVIDGYNVRCFDLVTGRVEWKLKVPQQGHAVTSVSCDIDGDGGDEALISSDNTLYAIGTNKKEEAGIVKWSLEFPDRLGPATVARLHQQGEVQIIVVCADGYVYGIGQK